MLLCSSTPFVLFSAKIIVWIFFSIACAIILPIILMIIALVSTLGYHLFFGEEEDITDRFFIITSIIGACIAIAIAALLPEHTWLHLDIFSALGSGITGYIILILLVLYITKKVEGLDPGPN